MKKLIRDNILKIEPYRAGEPIETLRREFGIEGKVCKLASNENPLGPSSLAIEAIRKSLDQGNMYPDDSCYYLKENLALHLRVAPENLIIGNGTTELILLIIIAFLNPGETLIMSKSSFIMAKLGTKMMDGNLIEVPLKEYKHDLDAILKAVTDITKIVYLDNPSNPIGTMVTQQEISRFMKNIPEDIIVVFDEAYYEYISRKDYPESLKFVKDKRNVLILRTFSKIYGLAGFRVGYCIAKEDFIDALGRVSPPFSVNRLAQIGAIAALDDKKHIEETKKLNESGKRFLYRNFEEMGVFYIPSETNFVTIDVKVDAKRVFEELQREGVIVRPLTMYGEPTFLRITTGTQKQNERFIDVFKRVYATENR